MKKIGKVLNTILFIGFGILFFVPIIIIVLTDIVRKSISLSNQLKKVKNAGYKISKGKEKGKQIYLFTFNLIVIKFLPNEIHDISFDGGKTFIPIIESNIGTPQERERLKHLNGQYHATDYRDRDMYDSTEEFIDFIIKNVSVEVQ